ncbi:MAG: transglycosylase SLT domain-containing protein [Deltaproteobacteria bacterium]|nr:transglycosylase SLT domain-containing protein [Deltaproteobacteria bacterium]
MIPKTSYRFFHGVVRCICLAAILPAFFPASAKADIPLLSDIIVAYNAGAIEGSLKNGTYRGEEGILRIGPDTGRELGLDTFVNAHYREAKALYESADRLYGDAWRVLKSAGSRPCNDARIKRLAGLAAQYNGAVGTARERMLRYHAGAALEADQRLNREVCLELMDRLLSKSFVTARNNLRDALGYFYNMCAGENNDGPPLSPANIRFVNHVFREFSARASKETLGRYDLDRNGRNGQTISSEAWKPALGDAEAPYGLILESVLTARKRAGAYMLDPLLFMAMIRQESNFNPRDVSHAGAAGLTQIMPATGKDMGMKNIFSPPYFKEARAFTIRERELRRSARALIPKIRSSDMTASARRACELMRSSGENRKKRVSLYKRYKKELLRNGGDDRLNPEKSIRYGYRYFSEMMRMHEGDISLALAAYNAGPHRVKQYNGIPPFTETVDYRNRVLRHYRGYLRRLKHAGGASAG